MHLDPEDTKAVALRMKRAHGHLASVIRMLEEGAECEDVVTQLAAVSKAISRSGFALVSTGMQKCVTEGEDVDVARLEKVFLSLA